MKKSNALLILAISLVVGLAINQYNLSFIRSNNPQNVQISGNSLVHDATVHNIDEKTYLPQIRNYLAGDGFTIDPNNAHMKVRRTPGYPLFYAGHYALLGEVNAHATIRYSQLLLHAIAAVLLSWVAFALINHRFISSLVGLLYGVAPFITGYTYYTVTESISPFLVVACLFLWQGAVRTPSIKGWHWAVLGLILGITVLVRPIIGLLLPVIAFHQLVLVVKSRRTIKGIILSGTFLALGFIVVLTPWVIRNYHVTDGEIIFLEKYYNGSPVPYGKGHFAMIKWWKGWGNEGAVEVSNVIINDTRNQLSPEGSIDRIMGTWPEYAFSGSNPQEVKEALLLLAGCYGDKINRGIDIREYRPGEELPPCEDLVKEKFDHLRTEFQAQAPFRYYVLSPLKRVKELIFHSFTPMWSFLNPEDGQLNLLQIAFKAASYLFNLMLYFSCFYTLFNKRLTMDQKAFLHGFPLIALLYLSFIHNHVEVRYMVIAYPFFFIHLGITLEGLFQRFKDKLPSKTVFVTQPD